MQDPDLGWIRNVMRVAGTECDMRRARVLQVCNSQSRVARRRALGSAWLLQPEERRAPASARRHTETGKFGLWGSAATLLVLLFVGSGITDSVRMPLVFVMA